MSELSNGIMVAATVVSAVGAGVSALAAWRMWKVSESTLNLQASIEDAKKPLAHFWYNQHAINENQMVGIFTLINIGGSPLPIRTLRVLFGSSTQVNATDLVTYKMVDEKKVSVGLRHSREKITDLLLPPHQVTFVEIVLQSGQLRFEVMYYDNTFEFVEVDTSILGGKYILTGQGRKY